MFIYLSKKIAIPNRVKLTSLSWNSEQGWIACGGEGGLLKVLKLDNAPVATADGRAPSTLSMNQTLEGHNGAVMVVNWNENYRKLTTSDEFGLIIVWMLHKGMWFEEMINNRNKSVVTDQKWTSDGQKICIIYADGAVIVGSVDGNRLWGKEPQARLQDLKLVCWSPDGKRIIFITAKNEALIYDSIGDFSGQLPLTVLETASRDIKAVGIAWYDGKEGFVEPGCPVLAIGFDNGLCQIMRTTEDTSPVLIDTGLQCTAIKWSTTGTCLAIAGTQVVRTQGGEERRISTVQFYTPFGVHMRTLKVPGNGITALTWEGASLRIALAVDSFIYFANIRQDYMWGYFSNTLVYGFTKAERPEHCVVFWDTKTDEKHTKYVRRLLGVRAAGDNCVLAKADDSSGTFILILCNAIGAPVDSKYIDVQPNLLAMTATHVIAADSDVVYVWQYRTMVSKLTSATEGSSGLRRQTGRERMFHIDEMPTGASTMDVSKFKRPDQRSADPICSIAASATCLIVGRQSGIAFKYTLPHISLEAKYQLRCRPQRMALNCDSTRLSIIDINGILSFFDLDTGLNPNGPVGARLPFERKDVWDMLWSDDNPKLFAMMEKTRMYIMRDLDPEEPVSSTGYLCSFSDLMIESAEIDEIMKAPSTPDREFLHTYETKSLRDTRDVLGEVDIKAAFSFVEEHPHPRLWRLIAEAALEALDFAIADQAFVACEDFQGIQFVKRLRQLDDKKKRHAEVAAYFKRFDAAEKIYCELDRKDLAIDLRMRLGDWFRVLQLVQSGAGDDALQTAAWNKIGHYYADRQKWAKAEQYYKQAKNFKQLVGCYYALDDYEGLEELVHTLADGDSLLLELGEKFTSVGMNGQAVRAFLRGGDVKAAIDSCVQLNQWDEAVQLAEEHNFPAIEGLLSKYANDLLNKGKITQAINMYRKANRHTATAKLLIKLARQVVASGSSEPDFVKKIYVLAAMEIEQHRSEAFNVATNATQKGATQRTAADQTQQTLDNLMKHDSDTASDKDLDIGWRGAEAYHFFMMAQRQFYLAQSTHKYDAALRTAMRLQDYDDVLSPVELYSLVALVSVHSGHLQQCSRAFTKLESMDDKALPAAKRAEFADLAMDVFASRAPLDPASAGRELIECPHCSENIPEWCSRCPSCTGSIPVCVASGKAVLTDSRSLVHVCKTCRHRSLTRELRAQALRYCPLCHTLVEGEASIARDDL